MDAESRWVELNAHRPRLIRVGRLSGLTREEAEDVASEAILRGARQPGLDMERCGSWLHVVARRLALDISRRRPTGAWLARVGHETHGAHDPHERTLEQLEACWVAGLVEELPERQRHVLHLRACGWDMALIAEQLEVSYKAIESLTSRARTTVREAMAKALGIGVGLGVLLRRLGRGPATPAVATAAVVCLLALVVRTPHIGPAPEPPARVVAPGVAESAGLVARSRVVKPAVETWSRTPERKPARTETTVVPPQELGPVRFGGLRTSRSTDRESLLDTALRCLTDGPALRLDYLGCEAP